MRSSRLCTSGSAMGFRPTKCPSCGSHYYKRVRARDSLARGREGYRLCLGCGNAYRPPKRLPLSAILIVCLVGAGGFVSGVLALSAENYTMGAIALLVGAVCCSVAWKDLFALLPADSVLLLPMVAGEPSTVISLWLSQGGRLSSVTLQAFRRAGGIMLQGTGVVMTLVGTGLFLDEYNPARRAGRLPESRVGPLAAAGGAVACAIGIPLSVFGRKLGAHRATQVLSRDSRPPILLLRSFDDDEIALPKTRPKDNSEYLDMLYSLLPYKGNYNTLEHTLVDTFRLIGPVIAIGAPGQVIAPSGAARTWFPHDVWKDRVEDLTKWAQRVILVLGDLERKGLAWEAQHLLTIVPPQKVVLVSPPHVGPTEHERRWEILRRLSHDRLPRYRLGTIAVYFPSPG
jgi:hypothetical protein